MNRGPLSTLAVVVLAVACSRPSSQGHPKVEWRVLDSTWAPPWHLGADSARHYRVVVRIGSHQDTVSSVLEPHLIIAGAGTLVGVQAAPVEGGRQLFVRDGEVVRHFPIPPDGRLAYDVAPSPGGKYLAYVATDDSGTTGVVRQLDSGAVVWRTASGPGCECDVDRNHVRWIDADSVELAIYRGDPLNRWLLVAARLSENRTAVDTLDNVPRWSGAR